MTKAALAAVILAVSAGTAGALSLGDGVPTAAANVRMKGVDGHEVSIADVRGERGTLVIFSCNACPWAKAWQERIAALANAAPGRGIGVVIVNSNDPEVVPEDGFAVMQERAAQLGLKVPYVVDATSSVARAFGATRTPEAFLFDRAGKLAYHGTIDDDAQHPDRVKSRYLQDAIDAVVVGGTVAVPETKALGCSIKFRS